MPKRWCWSKRTWACIAFSSAATVGLSSLILPRMGVIRGAYSSPPISVDSEDGSLPILIDSEDDSPPISIDSEDGFKVVATTTKPVHLRPCSGAEEISIPILRELASAFASRAINQAWVKEDDYTRRALERLAFKQNLFLWMAFKRWRNRLGTLGTLTLGPAIVCKFWTVFYKFRRFAVRSKYLKVGEGPRFSRTCRNNSVRTSTATALARGGTVCPYKTGYGRTLKSTVLNEEHFDPFTSPVADGGLAWNRTEKSCAVVGSSRLLRRKRLGNDIDAHDVVIRFNTAVVKGHEKDRGSRTDVRITEQDMIFYEDCDEIVLNVWSPSASVVEEVGWILPMEPVFYLGQSHACHKGSSFMKRWKGKSRHFSSGHRGICFALELCERVDVYGFGVPDSKGKSSGSSDHPWRQEYLARKRFGEMNRLCLHLQR